MIQNSEIQKTSLMKNDPLLVLDSYLTSTPLWRQTMLAFRFLVPFQQLFMHMQAIPKYVFFLTLSFLYEWKRNNSLACFFNLLCLENHSTSECQEPPLSFELQTSCDMATP